MPSQRDMTEQVELHAQVCFCQGRRFVESPVGGASPCAMEVHRVFVPRHEWVALGEPATVEDYHEAKMQRWGSVRCQDALLAETIFGWVACYRCGAMFPNRPAVIEAGGEVHESVDVVLCPGCVPEEYHAPAAPSDPEGETGGARVPDFTTDLQAAWKIVEHFQANGCTYFRLERNAASHWIAEFFFAEPGVGRSGHGEKAPQAIVKAAFPVPVGLVARGAVR